jgi:hypothetical protein
MMSGHQGGSVERDENAFELCAQGLARPRIGQAVQSSAKNVVQIRSAKGGHILSE